jgi:sugar lactone lactonase YvrE
VDSLGNLLVIDRGSATAQRPSNIRLVDLTGTITTLACDGPDPLGGPPFGPVLPAHQALCGNLTGVAVDSFGNVYITQGGGRTVDLLVSGIVSIINEQVASPANAAIDGAGNVYVADDGNCRVIKTNQSGGLAVIAGNGSCGFSGDNGPATAASLQFPNGVAVDATGNVYIADTNNARVRKVDTSGTITTIAGGACTTYGAGDGGPATVASLCYPSDVAIDSAGNLYISETNSGLIRRVDLSGAITTIAGAQTTILGDGGPATSASLAFPYSLALGPAGKIYIADTGHARIRLLTPIGATLLTGVSVTSTGFVYSRVTRTFNGTVTVTNTGQQAVAGPLQLVLTNLAAGIVLSNATGTTHGSSYVTIPSAATLQPGESASVAVQFQDPSNALITFTPLVYSGTF